MTYQTAKNAARRALLRGRVQAASTTLWVPAIVGAVALGLELDPLWVVSAFSLTVFFLFWSHLSSQRLGNASYAGALIGLVPFSAGSLAPHIGHACAGSYCYEFCLGVCALGGVFAGALAMRYARKQGGSKVLFSSSAPLLLTSGSLGCACVGADGIVALLGGVVLGGVIVAARRRLYRPS